MVEINLFRDARDGIVVEPEHVIFREGDRSDVMFAVVEGEVALSQRGVVIERVGPGGILGELGLIDDSPRSATATVASAARIVRVDKSQFVYLVQEHPTFALMVMSVTAERLRRHPVVSAPN
jgi:CRP/FNR family cyclic AMP-dependent transcriptional regulator